jgi:succinate-semialdehyde dehydrogenase / glutarate-semialdehyde dehydrogenase
LKFAKVRVTKTSFPAARQLSARNPRTGEHDFQFESPSQAQLVAMCTRARAAQVAWSAVCVDQRVSALQQFANLMAAERETLHAALSIDTGRHRLAHLEIDYVIGMLHGTKALGEVLQRPRGGESRSLPGVQYTTHLRPYALVAVISPWNFPLLLAMLDSIQALVAGCAVVIKPSEVTPRFAAIMQRLIERVPALDGALQFVQGDGVIGAALIDLADMVCFTGSVSTGRKVLAKAAERFIPVFLELGGKDPLIVLPGSDLKSAAACALRASVQASGQACQSIELIYVQRAEQETFLQELVTAAQKIGINFPNIDQGGIGPIIFDRQVAILVDQIRDAKDRGATIHCGGEIEYHEGGAWLRPTVISGIRDDMLLLRDETFGPLLPVLAYDDVAEAIARINASEYGLSAAVFGPDQAAACLVAAQLDVGAVSVNDAGLTSFVFEAEKQSFKASGLGGSRMGEAGVLRFVRKKAVLVQTGQPVSLDILQETQDGGS